MPQDTSQEIRDRLSAYFPAKAIKWLPRLVKGNKALAMPYIDARAVMRRLDDVLGIDGWEDHYEILPDGCVVCTLKCRIGERWVSKEDIGDESKQQEAGDKRKSAFSDALKRAAVKFGVGRYLYSLPPQWADYDPQRKQFTQTPRLPDWAIPKTAATPAPAPAKQEQPKAVAPPETKPLLSGKEFEESIKRMAEDWQKKGYCRGDILFLKLADWARGQGCDKTIRDWPAALSGKVKPFLHQLHAQFTRPAPQAMLDHIDQLCHDLGWSDTYQTERMTNANLIIPGEVPNEHRAQAIILYLQQVQRDEKKNKEQEASAGESDQTVDCPF